jgi:hypothetical protein
MAGGMKEMVINTQERAISPDINRLQKFKGSDVAELLRYLMNVTGNDDLDAAGVIVEPNTIATPLLAEIINGLLVRPVAGTLNLLVDPGVVLAMAPDAAPDDSNYKYIHDPGVTVAGNLVMTAGAGATRIDVVECQVTNIVTETDNRDIFDPTTGLFTATSVTKARQDTVTNNGAGAPNIRVRAGAPGGGYPAAVAGWLPLAVVSVPAAAASVDVMTFWDVRPLVNDRVLAPSALTRQLSDPGMRVLGYVDEFTDVTKATFKGSVEWSVGNRRLGGRLHRGSPGTDAEGVDLRDAANQSSGFAVPAQGNFVYVYLCQPFGLPRWARYTDGPANRVPRSPRGIPIVTTVAPLAITGAPSAVIPLPVSTGLGGSVQTTEGVCVASLITNIGPVISGGVAEGDWFFPNAPPPGLLALGGATVSVAKYTLVPGTHFPAHARVVRALISITASVNATHKYQYGGFAALYHPGSVTQNTAILYPAAGGVGNNEASLDNGDTLSMGFIYDIPITQQFPPGGPVSAISIEFAPAPTNSGSLTLAINGAALQVIGWKHVP